MIRHIKALVEEKEYKIMQEERKVLGLSWDKYIIWLFNNRKGGKK